LALAREKFAHSPEKLVAKFNAERDYYLSRSYLEAQARVDFITPFFKALGWDVENEAGLAHHAREVMVEQGESDTTGRPGCDFVVGDQNNKSCWRLFA
jgi:predicted type IV restriction endonuclease